MAGRPYWKGHLRLSLVSCSVALYPAVGSTSHIKCHTINRRTGNRINEEVVDSVTREPVPKEDRVKGCEVAKNELVPIEEEELQHIRLESTHTLNIESFVDRAEVDERYLDKPYYIAPEDKVSREAFAVIRDAMREKGKAGLGRLVLARKERVALLEPFDKGMMATLLRSADEVRSPTSTFEDIADFQAPADMRELAAQLIERNSARFDPSRFEDRYEQALIALVHSKAKPAGKGTGKGAANENEAPRSNVVNLMEALKRSIQNDKAGSSAVKEAAKAVAAKAPAAKAKTSDKKAVQSKASKPAPASKPTAAAKPKRPAPASKTPPLKKAS
jgi:DNA end-binding protein Ku